MLSLFVSEFLSKSRQHFQTRQSNEAEIHCFIVDKIFNKDFNEIYMKYKVNTRQGKRLNIAFLMNTEKLMYHGHIMCMGILLYFRTASMPLYWQDKIQQQ